MLRLIAVLLICSCIPARIYSQGDPPNLKRTHPTLLKQIQPEYSDEARLAQVTATVVAQVTVGADGSVTDFKIIRGIGFGLDEKAEEAVRQWQFQPREKDGIAVPSEARIEIDFAILGVSKTFGTKSLVFPTTPGTARPVLLKISDKLSDDGREDDAVILDLEVDASGRCDVVGVASGSQSDAEVVSAYVRTWFFEPARQGDTPVAMRGRLTYLMGKPLTNKLPPMRNLNGQSAQ